MIGPRPLTACAVVMYAALLHVIEAIMVMLSSAADGSLPIAALLWVIPNRVLLVGSMVLSALMAMSAISVKSHSTAKNVIFLLLPQQLLLVITAAGAWLAVWHGAYADGVMRSTLFITADQLPRGMFSLIHLTSITSLAFHQRATERFYFTHRDDAKSILNGGTH